MKLDLSLEKSIGSFKLKAHFKASGNRIGVFGPSGSGKSTLMLLLAGLLTPDQGYIRLEGETLFDKEKKINIAPEKRRIGVVFQHAHLFPHMNVKRNLMYGYKRIPIPERKIAIDTLVDVLALGQLLHRNVTKLSGGERQRVALGRALLACPRLILMDEPLTGLDQELKYQIMPYLKRVLNEFNAPLMFISHSLKEIRLMTDSVLIFKQGCAETILSIEELARNNMASGDRSYTNIITVRDAKKRNGLWEHAWGPNRLVMTEAGKEEETIFELSAKDITLFKRHPEASSARNLLSCQVTDIFDAGNRLGVELSCAGETIVCQIVPEAANELGISKGQEVIAAIKATAFNRVF